MIAHSDSTSSMAALLQRTLLIAFLGLLCLSNVLVQGQTTTASPLPTATGTAVTNPATGTATGTAAGTATGTGSAALPSATTPPRSNQAPLSSLTMLEPKANSASPPLFPIGVDLSFSWTYDQYLLLQPTNITIEAYPVNSPSTIITIGSGLAGNTKNYTWPAASQVNATNPIITAVYTLRIYDGAVGRYGTPPGGGGGYLATYTGLKFGLYIPSPYTPGNQMNPPVCATCQFSKITNGAMKTLAPAVSAFLVAAVSTALVLV